MLTYDADELVLHCAVMATETEESIDLVKYLIKTCLWSLEAKDALSNTPLLTAASLGRVQFMRLLIAAGADESVRNSSGENVIHRLVSEVEESDQFKAALDLLDADLRAYLFKQRCNLENGGLTPLHRLVGESRNDASHYTRQREQILELLLEYSKGVEIEMLNAAGDSVLHTAVMRRSPWLTQFLVDFHPKLLYRENAVGQTPAELACHNYMAEFFVEPSNTMPREQGSGPDEWMRSIRAAAKSSPPSKYANSAGGVWEICRTEMARHPDKRSLVSLHEANDVAKRLGEQYTSSRYVSSGPCVDDYEESEQGADDEATKFVVQSWRNNRQSAWKQHKTEEELERERQARLGKMCTECGHRHPVEEEDDSISDIEFSIDEIGSDGSESGGSDSDGEGSDDSPDNTSV